MSLASVTLTILDLHQDPMLLPCVMEILQLWISNTNHKQIIETLGWAN